VRRAESGANPIGASTNRREFLGKTAVAAASAWTGGSVFAAGASASPGPNETIHLGIIGCGSRAKELLPSFVSAPGTRVTAVCDVNSKHLEEVRQLAGGDRVRAYRDYRKLLDDKNVNAVFIATNVHWHVLCTIGACQAGKDVYVEKPLHDFDGDGRLELITGKRVRAHVLDGDPGSREPECLYYYRWVKAARKFARHTISGPGGGVGVGCQICVADLNGDNRPDLVVAGKTGTWILTNVGKSAAEPSLFVRRGGRTRRHFELVAEDVFQLLHLGADVRHAVGLASV